MILHIPHSSTYIPAEITFGKDNIEADLMNMTDWYTDELFHHVNSDRVVSSVSRLVCDVERFVDNEPMEKYGMGICYTKDSFGGHLRDVSAQERESIIEQYYRPHHSLLTQTVAKTLAWFDHAVIVDCHSFSPEALPHESSGHRPNFCIGVDDYHTPQHLVDGLVEVLEKYGYSYNINHPFSGSMVPELYYKKNPDVWSIMIEVNRGLYLDGDKKTHNFEQIQSVVTELLNTVDRLENNYENL